MGSQLGFFADRNEIDYPELNKCPSCETFFADEKCPLCGEICPEEYRAGNRKPVKPPKKRRRSNGNGRVQFIPWYYSTPFIIAMLIFMPVVGLILVWTGPWRRGLQILATVLVLLVFLLPTILGFLSVFLLNLFLNNQTPPYSTTLSQAEYVELCQTVDAEQLYRYSDAHAGEFVTLTLTVTDVEEAYDESSVAYQAYVCETVSGGKTWTFLLLDCQESGEVVRLTVGDTVTCYGEVCGTVYLTEENGSTQSLPGIYTLFFDLESAE